MQQDPINGSSSLTPVEIAAKPEVAEFCDWLSRYVDSGDGADELTVATASLIRLARDLRLEAIPIVEAVEVIGCPPLRVQDRRARARGDRYTSAMAWLVRGLIGGA